ncbi:MAG: hypothetical protein U0531_10180 [Dehalococcoidia bacterium]
MPSLSANALEMERDRQRSLVAMPSSANVAQPLPVRYANDEQVVVYGTPLGSTGSARPELKLLAIPRRGDPPALVPLLQPGELEGQHGRVDGVHAPVHAVGADVDVLLRLPVIAEQGILGEYSAVSFVTTAPASPRAPRGSYPGRS